MECVPLRDCLAVTATQEALSRLRDKLDATLDAVLGEEATIVMPDFPNFPNCGDSAMFMGVAEYLARRPRLRLAYIGERGTRGRALLRRLPEDGVVLLGGGNGLGDVWLDDQLRREELIASLRDWPIVLAPQSIHFGDDRNLARAREVLSGHPRLTLLCRDANSYELAQREFDVRVELCQDVAFLLGPLSRPAPPTTDVVWLSRTDHEALPSSSPGTVRVPPNVEVGDWVSDLPVAGHGRMRARLVRSHSSLLQRATAWPSPRSLDPLRNSLYVWLARNRVHRALSFLSRGRVVITDRLHGHILCTLMGIPHVLLPNSDGKTLHFYRSWPETHGTARWCERADAALAVAESLLREGARSPS
jgi:exopolysaccharide biosynthesis predicted pyruvyltransferase EpsI